MGIKRGRRKQVWYSITSDPATRPPFAEDSILNDIEPMEISNTGRVRNLGGDSEGIKSCIPEMDEGVEVIKKWLGKDHEFNNPPMEYVYVTPKNPNKEVWHEVRSDRPETIPPFDEKIRKRFEDMWRYEISNRGRFSYPHAGRCEGKAPTDPEFLAALAFIKEWLGKDHPFNAPDQWHLVANRWIKVNMDKLD